MPDALTNSSSSALEKAKPRFAWRRWLILLSILLILAMTFALDRRMKSGGSLTGYAPSGATLVVASNDLAGAWADLEASTAYQLATETSPQVMYNLVLDARKRTGIRWTPRRVSTWLGQRVVVARDSRGTSVCVRTGLLGRALWAASGVLGEVEAASGVRALRGVSMGYRDGYLILSNSGEYVGEALAQDATAINLERPDSGVQVRWEGDLPFDVWVRPGDDLKFEGWAGLELTPRRKALTLADVWPDDSLLHVTGTDPSMLRRLVADLMPEYPGTELVERAIEEVEERLPANWTEDSDEYSMAILAVDTAEILAVPELAYMARGDGVANAMPVPPGAIAYEWSGYPGWMREWLGEKLSVCVAQREDTRLFTSQERNMRRLLESPMSNGEVEVDFKLAVDLAGCSQVAEVIVRRAAENELTRERNVEDVERELVPLVKLVGALGALHVEGQAVADGMSIQGRFELPAEDAEEVAR